MRPVVPLAAGLLLVASCNAHLQAQVNRIKVVPVTEGIHMIMGSGGNIGVFTGADGPVLVDDQYAPATPRILAAVGKLSKDPVRFVINTHWHQDHTGGNENLGKVGALIVAHENVRKRMSVGAFMKAFGRKIPPSPPKALPVITFTKSLELHWNGDSVQVIHVPHAHTDGDAIVRWKKADVLHMGDLYFNGMYPFIDVQSGGSLEGVIRAADRALELAGEKTQIIPGHGVLSKRAGLVAYRTMLATVRNRLRKLIAEGRSADEVVKARPTRDLDAKWGRGFMQPERWVRILHADLSRNKAPSPRK